MKCPCCNQEMKVGTIYPLNPKSSYETYWLPKHTKLKGLFISKEKIIESGGLLIGAKNIFSENNAQTYHCKKCKMLFTKLDG